MIFDKLENAPWYSGMGRNLKKGLEFLETADLANLPLGRIDIDGDLIFALVQEYNTVPKEEKTWEGHRKYIDIQYVVSGEEIIGYVNTPELTADGEYSEENDFIALKGEGNFIKFKAGSFGVFGPEDAHMPGVTSEKVSAVRKIVVKVLV